jgi:RNA polymerase primary sigma factor
MTWENYFDGEMKKVISTNNLLVLNSLKNKAQTLFGLEILVDELRVKLEETANFFEVKNGFFVCKNYLKKVMVGDEFTLKERLENEYFIDFNDEDLERIISEKRIDKKEKIYGDLNEYEKLAIYISARSQRHFIKRFAECFNNRYSDFIVGKKIYENGVVTLEAMNISKEIEKKLNLIVGELKFLKWVTLPEIKLEELWIELKHYISKELVLELTGIMEGSKKVTEGEVKKDIKSGEEVQNQVKNAEIIKDLKSDKPLKALEELSIKKLIYSEDDLVMSVIDWILKNRSPLRLSILGMAGIFNCSVDRLVSVLSKNRKLFYFATRKTIHFKPYIAGVLVYEFYGKKLSRRKLEKKMSQLFDSKSFNRAELNLLLSEYSDVFISKDDYIDVIMNSERYVEYITEKYSPKSVQILEKCIRGKLGIDEASERLKISTNELSNILNLRKELFVKDGVIEKIKEETNEIKLEKIMFWFDYINKEYKEGFNDYKLGIILSRIVKNTPIDIDEIYNNLWLFHDRISKNQIEKVLKENEAFKMVDFKKYVSSDCVIYSAFKNDFKKELENVLSVLKNSEKKVLRKRLINKNTLEEIGKEMRLTRERVRQIEKKILLKLHTSKSKNLIPYLNVVENILRKSRVIEIAELEKKLNSNSAFRDVEIRYMLSIFEIFTGIKLSFYFDKYVGIISREELLESLQEFLDQPIKFRELAYELEKKGIKNEKFLRNYIKESDQIESCRNFILIKEGKINSGDKIRLIFYNEGRELKIEELTNLCNEYYNERISEHAIHGRLLNYDNIFTRVFTGTYSLSEWGAEKHINSIDLIEEYLEKIRKPVSYQEILENVMSRTRAKEQTVRIFLASSKKTFAYSHGEWALVKWKDDPKISKKYHISENRIQASYSGLTHIHHKGYLEKNGRKVSLHMVGGAYLKHSGSMNLGAGVFDNDKMDICIYVKDRKFEFTTYGSNGSSIYGVKEMLEYAGIGEGDYFYLEYWPDGNIAFYTWDEYEDYTRRGDPTPNPTVGEKYTKELPEPKNDVSEPTLIYSDIVTFDKILRQGLETGMVQPEILFQINYDNEKEVKDIHEAMEILEERGVRILM